MKIKGKAIFLSAILCLAFLLYLKVTATIEEYTFMDDFMEKEYTHCEKCHDRNIKSYKDVKEISASCMRADIEDKDKDKTINGIGCHSRVQQTGNPALELGRSHPYDIEPTEKIMGNIPEDLHLEDGQLITCATCHDPRKDPTSTEKWVGGTEYDDGYKTYFLRRKNTNSDLCHVCHQDKI